MLRPLLNAAYWVQVQSMSERERRKFDATLVADPASTTGGSGLDPGAQLLAGMMRKGGV